MKNFSYDTGIVPTEDEVIDMIDQAMEPVLISVISQTGGPNIGIAAAMYASAFCAHQAELDEEAFVKFARVAFNSPAIMARLENFMGNLEALLTADIKAGKKETLQ